MARLPPGSQIKSADNHFICGFFISLGWGFFLTKESSNQEKIEG